MPGEHTIAVSGLHKAALRASILDPDDFDARYADELDSDGNPLGFSMLLSFSAGTMVRRRFSTGCSWADVIRYVAALRISLDEDAHELDARMAENVIRTFLGDPSLKALPPFGGAPEDAFGAVFVVLAHLVWEAGLDDDGVDELINEAAEEVTTVEIDWSVSPFSQYADHYERAGRNTVNETE